MEVNSAELLREVGCAACGVQQVAIAGSSLCLVAGKKQWPSSVLTFLKGQVPGTA